jgi:hypothetical protein
MLPTFRRDLLPEGIHLLIHRWLYSPLFGTGLFFFFFSFLMLCKLVRTPVIDIFNMLNLFY